jgi:hypothetical protein
VEDLGVARGFGIQTGTGDSVSMGSPER